MKKVAFVTGSNQGLGFALIKNLCRNLPTDEFDIYLTARDEAKGKAAIALLKKEGLSVHYHQLDVTDISSLSRFREYLEQKHGGIDILIHNAAARINKEDPQEAQVRQFVETNNTGTFNVISTFSPLLTKHSSFLIVASSFGSLRHLSSDLHYRFDGPDLGYQDINDTMNQYISSVEQGTAQEEGWPNWINIPSKVGQVALTRILAKITREQRSEDDIFICSVCPGLVDTEASRPWFDDMSNAQTPEEAAKAIIWLLDTERSEFYGKLIQFKKIIPWDP